MEFNDQQKKAAKIIELVSPIYTRGFISRREFREQFGNGYTALVCFLENYAYERQGAPAAYPEIAKQSIEQLFKNRSGDTPTKRDSNKAWKEYKEIARKDFNDLSLNKKLNPMNKDKGVLWVLADVKVSNIATHTRDLIRKNKTKEAHNFIINIRGVGEKISSMYLRDIAYLAKLDEKSISDQYLLQPIDTWLEQTLEILFSSNVPKGPKKKRELIVELCTASDVSAISFNQGAWVLGSQIAGDFETFKKALNDRKFTQKLIKNKIKNTEKYLSELKKVLEKLRHAG